MNDNNKMENRRSRDNKSIIELSSGDKSTKITSKTLFNASQSDKGSMLDMMSSTSSFICTDELSKSEEDYHSLLYGLILSTLKSQKEQLEEAKSLVEYIESGALDTSIDKRNEFDLWRVKADLARLEAPNMYQPLKDVFQRVMDQNKELAEVVQRGVINPVEEETLEQAFEQAVIEN